MYRNPKQGGNNQMMCNPALVYQLAPLIPKLRLTVDVLSRIWNMFRALRHPELRWNSNGVHCFEHCI